MKHGEHYELQRDKLFGSVAWGRKAETVVGIQYAEGSDATSTVRELKVLPRNGKNETFYFDFQNGRMVQVEKPEPEQKECDVTKRFEILAKIRELPNGTKLSKVMFGVSNDTYAAAMDSA